MHARGRHPRAAHTRAAAAWRARPGSPRAWPRRWGALAAGARVRGRGLSRVGLPTLEGRPCARPCAAAGPSTPGALREEGPGPGAPDGTRSQPMRPGCRAARPQTRAAAAAPCRFTRHLCARRFHPRTHARHQLRPGPGAPPACMAGGAPGQQHGRRGDREEGASRSGQPGRRLGVNQHYEAGNARSQRLAGGESSGKATRQAAREILQKARPRVPTTIIACWSVKIVYISAPGRGVFAFLRAHSLLAGRGPTHLPAQNTRAFDYPKLLEGRCKRRGPRSCGRARR
jgi:hypothetical protein